MILSSNSSTIYGSFKLYLCWKYVLDVTHNPCIIYSSVDFVGEVEVTVLKLGRPAPWSNCSYCRPKYWSYWSVKHEICVLGPRRSGMSNSYVKLWNLYKYVAQTHTCTPSYISRETIVFGCTNIKTSWTAGEPTSNGHFNFYYKLEWSFSAVFYIPLVLVLYLYLTTTNLVLGW
jgi:hypothetical protein